MSEFMSYDPWAEITTRNGYAGDEMVAMLQKAIRRGKEEDALHAAYDDRRAMPDEFAALLAQLDRIETRPN